MSRPTQDTTRYIMHFVYEAFTPYGLSFQTVLLYTISPHRSPITPAMPKHYGFGLFPVRSPLLRKSLLFSLPAPTQMFQFSAFASFRIVHLQCTGFPHSDMYGSTDICSSPYLFAAYHVLLRLSKPRHPPCALSNLSISSFFLSILLSSINSNMSMNFQINICLFLVEDNGFEPLTPCVQGRCSSQLS